LQSESILEYQNKALAAQVNSLKSRVKQLEGEQTQAANERTQFESGVASLANLLTEVSKSSPLNCGHLGNKYGYRL
jgi:predicted nuclease with TOPRIM domain